jgi:hypothetical protein
MIHSTPVATHLFDLGAALLAKLGEETPDRISVPSVSRPPQPAGVVIDDHHEIAMALAVADLVDADSPQAAKQVLRLFAARGPRA